MFGIFIFIYINKVESIKELDGKFFDETGKELGTCKIEATMYHLADMPEYKTYYNAYDEQYTGYCKGSSIECFAFSEIPKKEPQICSSYNLQTQCEKPNEALVYGVKAKYDCIIQ